MTNADQLCISIEHIPPEGFARTGEVVFAALGIEDDVHLTCPNPLRFELWISPLNNGVIVRGQLSSVLTGRCDRCLDEYDLPIATSDVCHLLEGLTTPIIDLTENVREDILLTFPQQCLCQADCQGLCHTCGQNLNTESCTCPPQNVREEWHALDGLSLPGVPNLRRP